MAEPETSGRAGPASCSDLAVWIEQYTPRGVRPETWETRIRPFVVAALLDFAPISLTSAKPILLDLTRLALWSLENGLPLTREVILHPANVERFSRENPRSSRGTDRSRLRRLGKSLLPDLGWRSSPRPMSKRKVPVPYTLHELSQLISDLEHQSTYERKRIGLAIFLLGAGAGLDSQWFPSVRGCHVTPSGEVVLVSVGPPHPRSVPVLARYAEALVLLAQHAGPDLLIGERQVGRNTANRLVAQLEVGPNHPRLLPTRLRATWLAHHLALGTRVPELLKAAGLATVARFDDLLHYVEPLSHRSFEPVLRGPK
jgi:hypothetical protein